MFVSGWYISNQLLCLQRDLPNFVGSEIGKCALIGFYVDQIAAFNFGDGMMSCK
jgi:hypothetical protein